MIKDGLRLGQDHSVIKLLVRASRGKKMEKWINETGINIKVTN